MRLRIGVLVTSAALIVPAAASAKTYCVYQPPNAEPAPPCDTIDLKVQDALSKAQSNPGPDTVRIGAGSFLANPGSGGHSYIGGNDEVHIVGSGPATRLLRGDNGPVLDLNSTPASTVSNLTVAPVAGSSPGSPSVGVRATNATISSVTVDPANASANVTGFELGTGELDNATALLTPSGAGNTGAKFTSSTGTAVVNGSTLSGVAGLELRVSDAYVDRTRISAYAYGIYDTKSLNVSNSTIRMTPATANQFGMWIDVMSDTTVFARHVTIVGDGATGSSAGIYARASAPTASTALTVNVNNSIVRGFTSAFSAVNGTAGNPAYTMTETITPRYSDFPSAAAYPASAMNVNLDPAFVDAANGDYRLPAGSPVIDRGDPGSVIGGDGTDLAGNPRAVDGDGNGSAIRDIGAYEFQPPPPPSSGTTPGGTTPGGGPGGSTTPGGGGEPGSAAASVTALKLSPNKFRAAGSGPAVTAAAKKRKAKIGSLVSFALSAPGTVNFAIQKKGSGRRTKGKCVKATRKNRKAKRCTLYTAVKNGSFSRDGAAGANSFRLTGRVGKKALRAGSYRLVATPAAAIKPAAFKIVR
jgi:hypothetical protein